MAPHASQSHRPHPTSRGVRLPRHAGAPFKVDIRGQDARWYDDVYHRLLVVPWWQFFGLIALVFLIANAIFGGVFLLEDGAIGGARRGSFEDAFFFSVQTLATIGYGSMYPATRFGHCVVTLEAFVGLMSVALMTGLTFAKFARPTARVLFAEKFVVSRINGVPHVMFRMANWRVNLIVEAQLHLVVLLDERTAEGEIFRRPVELPLVRDRNATFILSWTAMHRIDEKSPFFTGDAGGDPLERLRAMNAQIFLSLTGLDETMGQTIHARYHYTLDDCVVNAKFADVVTPKHDGSRVVDYSFFHDVIALEPPQGGADE
ncbi:MAG: ion channel [Polyangiaceae bacterium]